MTARLRRSARRLRSNPLAIAALLLATCGIARAQLSFTSAIDLALKHDPRVLLAQADVDKARANLAESRDVYIPSVVGGSGLGYSYGFPVGQPSIYNFTAQSLVFNFSQHDYIRAARSGLEAANFALMDARQATAEETAIAFLALDRDLAREQALEQEAGYAARLVRIVQDRLDAGQDSPMDLTTARLTHAQLRLSLLHDQDETEADRNRLARLTGLPSDGLATDPATVPAIIAPVAVGSPPEPVTPPGLLAAYANAHAKAQQAFGDARYERRPQIFFGAQYNRFAKYNGYDNYYKNFQHNNAQIGVQISLPIFDAVHRARARGSAAEAVRALHEADQQRDLFLDGRLKIRHAAAELAARSEVAGLDRELAQQQLDAMLVQLDAGNGNLAGRQMSPKDEQNARIAEREKYLAVLNTTLQVRQTQINLLRQTGQLEPWLKSLVSPASGPGH